LHVVVGTHQVGGGGLGGGNLPKTHKFWPQKSDFDLHEGFSIMQIKKLKEKKPNGQIFIIGSSW
jgi:hypothetical protein